MWVPTSLKRLAHGLLNHRLRDLGTLRNGLRKSAPVRGIGIFDGQFALNCIGHSNTYSHAYAAIAAIAVLRFAQKLPNYRKAVHIHGAFDRPLSSFLLTMHP